MQKTINPQPKPKAWRSKEYLEWLRKQRPFIGGSGQTVYHHLKMFHGGGIGVKPPDDHCIPVADSVHKRIHQYGEYTTLCVTYGYSKAFLKSLCRNYRQLWENENVDNRT